MVSVHHNFDSEKYFSATAINGEDGLIRFKGAECISIPPVVYESLKASKKYYIARKILRDHFADCQIHSAFPELWIHCHNFDAAKNDRRQHESIVKFTKSRVEAKDTPFEMSNRELAKASIV